MKRPCFLYAEINIQDTFAGNKDHVVKAELFHTVESIAREAAELYETR